MADLAPQSGVLKHKRGKPPKSGEKTIILNVFNKFVEKYPDCAIDDIVKLTSEFTGVSVSSVYSVRKEKSTTGKVTTPGKKRPRTRSVLDVQCDDFIREAVRRIVHVYFQNNELPTINKVLACVKSDPELPDLKKSSLHTLLKEIGFEFINRKRKSVIVDRDDIILWRRRYLRKIREFREQRRKVYYLDETWVNEGHTKSKVWRDTTVKSKKQAFLSGLSAGLKNPTGRGKRLIVLHIGSEDGFVEGGDLVFESKKTGDYHEDMNVDVFKSWFELIVPKLVPNSVIVMDNVPYHSMKLEHIPNKSWRKADIIAWLNNKSITFDEGLVKAELLQLVKSHGPQFEKYLIDDLAEQKGHTVLRLPPYHCDLNPIELVWSQVKGYVATNNTTFRLADVRNHVYTAFHMVTADEWNGCVQHVIREEKKMWDLEGMVDNIVDKVVINLGEESSEASDSETSELEGVEPLSCSD